MAGPKKDEINGEIAIKAFVVSVYVCRKKNGQGRYLILKRKSGYMYGLWQQVSGKILQDEKGWQAALREIKEETGIVPESLYSVDVVESFYEATQNCINIIPVFVAFVSDNCDVKLSSEHSEYRWVTAQEAMAYVSYAPQKMSIETIEREFVNKEPPETLRIDFNK